MRLKIKNKTRFTVFVFIIILILLITTRLIVVYGNNTQNHIEYQPYKVGHGDTYWQIAKELQRAGYKTNADIREIVYELVKISGIKAHELKAGDIIYIPVLSKNK